MIKATNAFGQPYATTTNNFFKGEYKHGAKDNEFDAPNTKDRYISANNMMYKD